MPKKNVSNNAVFSPTVLVVDDNFHDLQLAKVLLNKNGYFVKCESNSKKALDHVLKYNTDTIILDLIMPNMDGFNFLDQLRKNHKCDNVVVIVWTAKDLTTYEWTQLKNFANTVVLKGRDSTDTLLSKIQHLRPVHKKNRLH